jgi:hypothetical protein
MSGANFYQILGVGRSASADEIRTAYRDLVKKHHPDLFPTAGEKAIATEKLRQINEAYAVLGNAKRRQRYDQDFVEKARTPPRAPAAANRPRPSRPPRQAQPTRKPIKIPKVQLHFSKKWAGYSLAAAVVILVLIYASQSVPRLITAWTLWEKVEISPPNGVSPSDGTGGSWVPVGQYVSVSKCTETLKERVRKDEQEGSRSVFGEPNGTMAITVHIKKDAAPARTHANANTNRESSASIEGGPKPEQQLPPQENGETVPTIGMTKRVRNLECRVTQRFETESRFRRALRKIGLLA